MNHHLKAPRQPLARSAILLASFTVSAACLCAVALIFDRASSDPFLRDSAEARLAVARCDEPGNRGARDRCVHILVVEAGARDADAPGLQPSRPSSAAAEASEGVTPLRPAYRL